MKKAAVLCSGPNADGLTASAKRAFAGGLADGGMLEHLAQPGGD